MNYEKGEIIKKYKINNLENVHTSVVLLLWIYVSI